MRICDTFILVVNPTNTALDFNYDMSDANGSISNLVVNGTKFQIRSHGKQHVNK